MLTRFVDTDIDVVLLRPATSGSRHWRCNAQQASGPLGEGRPASIDAPAPA